MDLNKIKKYFMNTRNTDIFRLYGFASKLTDEDKCEYNDLLVKKLESKIRATLKTRQTFQSFALFSTLIRCLWIIKKKMLYVCWIGQGENSLKYVTIKKFQNARLKFYKKL